MHFIAYSFRGIIYLVFKEELKEERENKLVGGGVGHKEGLGLRESLMAWSSHRSIQGATCW